MHPITQMCLQLKVDRNIGNGMSRINSTFRYRSIHEASTDENGYQIPGSVGEWIDGIECYVEIHIPAKQVIGVDGQVFTYNFSVFIPKYFEGDIDVAQEMELTYDETGKTEIISIKGVDNLNRKYIEVWA